MCKLPRRKDQGRIRTAGSRSLPKETWLQAVSVFRGLMTEFDQCGECLLHQQRKVLGKIKTGEKREEEWRGGKAGAQAPMLPRAAGGWGGCGGTWGSALWSPCLYTRITSIQGPG